MEINLDSMYFYNIVHSPLTFWDKLCNRFKKDKKSATIHLEVAQRVVLGTDSGKPLIFIQKITDEETKKILEEYQQKLGR